MPINTVNLINWADIVIGTMTSILIEAFIKDMKRGFSGYKIEKTGVRTHFYLTKGGNTYHLSYTPTIATSHVMGSSRV